MIRAILHADKNWGIGKNNSLMFSIPKDMKFFRETTLGKTVVMGGNTLRSFPAGKPLKNRTNIVLSRGQVMDDCLVVSDLEALKAEMRRRAETEDLYVIGGASVYAALLPYCGGYFFPRPRQRRKFCLRRCGGARRGQRVYSSLYEVPKPRGQAPLRGENLFRRPKKVGLRKFFRDFSRKYLNTRANLLSYSKKSIKIVKLKRLSRKEQNFD